MQIKIPFTDQEYYFPQFIRHIGYTWDHNVFQLSIPNPANTKPDKIKHICYANPDNTVLDVWDKKINGAIQKLSIELEKDKDWKEVTIEDFIEMWGEKDLNYLSKLSK